MKNHKKNLKIVSLIFLVFCLHIISFYIKKISEFKSLKHDASTEETDRVEEYVAVPYSYSKQEEMFNEPLEESIEPLAALTDEDLSNIRDILEKYSGIQELEFKWVNKTTDIKYIVILTSSYNEYYNEERFCQDFIMEEITRYGTNTVSKKACQSSNRIWMIKEQMGAAGGAASGALLGQAIGNNTESTLIGADIGGMLGYVIGNEMDKYDRQMLNQVYESTSSGQAQSWVNPDQGNRYQVTPQQAYIGPNNQQCRKAEILAVIDGRTERTYSTACRDMNGQWQLQ